jgi:hypothetical protein
MRHSPLAAAVVALGALLFGFAACSSAPPDRLEDRPFVRVAVISTPPGAMISLDGTRIGRAPVTLSIESNEDGSMRRDVQVRGDFGTNPMTPSVTDAGTFTITSNDFAPRQLKFYPAGGGAVTIEPVGRALAK